MNSIALISNVLVWLAILAGGWFGWQLLRQNGLMLLRLDELEKRFDELEFGEGSEEPEGLPVGTDAPAFELSDLAEETKTLAQYRGQPVLLVFFNPDCGFCRELVPKLAALPPHPVPLPAGRGEGGRSLGEGFPLPRLLLITTGGVDANRQFFAEHKVGCPVLLQNDGEVAKAYQVNGTPSGYLISPDGKITGALAMGAEALLALATQASEIQNPKSGETRQLTETAAMNGNGHANQFGNRSLALSKIKRDGLKAGTPAPDFRLPRLDGRGDLTLSEVRGKRMLLVFSSPGCGPCNALAPELEKFYRQHPEVELVMISKGEPKENRAKVKEFGLTFPIVMQQQWEISRRYAMFATPIAYRIDEDGLITQDVAVGMDSILQLATAIAESPDASKRQGALAIAAG